MESDPVWTTSIPVHDSKAARDSSRRSASAPVKVEARDTEASVKVPYLVKSAQGPVGFGDAGAQAASPTPAKARV